MMKVKRPAWLTGLAARDPLAALALAAVIGLALALRLYGLDWDRGYSFTPHPDERAILMTVGEMGAPSISTFFDADASPWNPRRFDYGSVPFYLLKAVQLLHSALPLDALHDLRVTGRAISGLADTCTVALVYLLGSRIYGRREGLLAAALVATAVIHVQLSHFYATDILLALFSVATLCALLGVARTGSVRLSALAGVFVGLGMSTKISQAPIYLAFATAHLMYLFAATHAGPGSRSGEPDQSGTRERLRTAVTGLITGLAVSVATFAIAEPYAFLDWQRFMANVVEQSEMVQRIRDYVYTLQYVDTPAYWYQVQQLATWGLGWPLGIAAWGGLLYAALRGMRLGAGLVYLAAGWGAPAAILLYSSGMGAIILASLIALAALLATLPLRSPQSRACVLLLSWVVPYLLIVGAFEVKFLRYMIPVVPFLVLFGARMAFALWDRLTPGRPALSLLLALGLAALVGATGFYGAAYASTYRQPHTAVRAAQWINSHAPEGAVLLKEHWEESLPNLGRYEVRELPMYERDDRGKIERLAEELAGADYVVFYSNRLYGTIPRLPERYPLSGEYYRLLFSGGLGYELARVETGYPQLAGVAFVHDTLGRPGLPYTELPAGAALPIRLGFADESFSVYDHPVVLVLENTARYGADSIRRRIEGSYAVGVEASGGPPGPMLTAGEVEAQRAGGTWTAIVRPGILADRWPVAAWLLLIQGVGILTLPIAFAVLSPLADRGYLLAKPLGLLLVGLAVWLLASLRWVSFSADSVALCLAVLFAVSTALMVMRRREIVGMVARHWKALLLAEAVFLVAFLSLVALRMANPDLWHPFRGGEKPMDFAYLNAVVRSSYMPPYDPWFSGGFINYYYWGQFLVATLVRATGIDTAVAYNLAVPTFFAMTVGGAYSVVYNLAEATRRGGTPASRWPSALAGITGAIFVAVLGNLDGAAQVAQGVWRALLRNMPFGEFDFWRSSRMMGPDPPGHEITEFPFFTFLLADLHAHLTSMPFTLLAVGIALAVVLGAFRSGSRTRWDAGHAARLLFLGLTVGALRVLNTWDFPTYAALSVGAVLLAEYFAHGGWGLAVLGRAAMGAGLAMIVGFAAFAPYHVRYEAFFSSIEETTNTTVLWQFLGIHGLFIFIIGSFLAYQLRGWWLPALAWVWRRVGGRPSQAAARRAWAAGIGALLAAAAALVVAAGWTGSTIPFLAALAVPIAVVGADAMRRGSPDGAALAFAAMAMLIAVLLAVGLDVFRVEGDVDRMNSVFKFYLHVWVLLALAAAYLLWRMRYGWGIRLPRGWPRGVWTGSLLVLLAAAAVYPVLGTRDRLRDRFDGAATPLTLNGAAFMEDAVYWDQGGLIALSDDLQAIEWLKGAAGGRANVEGSPVVLEAQTPSYRWGGRVSVYTGLPGILGWSWHQTQQRWDYRSEVARRIEDVDRVYETASRDEALEILRRYGVEYVYVGEVERLYYPESGLAKFEDGLGGALDRVYDNAGVTIYRLRPG